MPLFWVSLCFAGGILLSALLAQAGLRMPPLAWAGLAGAPLFIGLALGRVVPAAGRLLQRLPEVIAPPALLAAAFFMGAGRMEAAQPRFSADHIARLAGSGMVEAAGWVTAPVEAGDGAARVRLDITAARLVDSGPGLDLHPARGTILVRVEDPSGLAYGDRLVVTGRLDVPPEWEDFSYKDYLARQGVYAWMPSASIRVEGHAAGSPILAWIYRLRQRLYAVIQQLFPAPESELLAGILLGIEGGIPAGLSEAFKVTGTAHIIAISGFNMAVLAAMLSRIFNRMAGSRRGLALTVLGLAFYTILAGAGASVVRAAVMGVIGLYGREMGRRQAGMNSLTFTGALMCVINPNWLWDVGFQLSFTATLGLVLYAAPLEALALRVLQSRLGDEQARRASRLLADYVLLTFAAQITTLPVMAYHFGRLSLSAFLVNPLALPVQPAVMVSGGLAALAGLVSRPLASLIALPAWAFSAYTIRMVELWALLPGASFYTSQGNLLAAGLYYAVLAGLTTGLRGRISALKPYLRPGLALLVTASLAAAVWRQALAQPGGKLVIEILPGEGAPAVLVHTPTGRSLLVGAGGSQTRLAAELGRRLPLWGARLDGIIISEPDGLAQSVEQYRPGWGLWLDAGNGNAADELEAALARVNTVEAYAQAGQLIDLGEGAMLEILRAGQDEPVLRIRWQNFQVWLLAEADSLLAGLAIPHADPVILLDGEGDESGGMRVVHPPAGGWLRMETDGDRLWLEEGY